MSRDKQMKWLEDLSEDILEQYTEGYSKVDKEMLAVALYNIGCRKSTDVAAEIFDYLDRYTMVPPNEDYEELKKKYESEGAE